MKKLLLLVPALALAQNVRVPVGGYCDIVSVSTAGVITYAANGSCSPTEGQVIFISDVRAGNNMHPVNSRADTNHRYRKIKAGTLNLGARTFQVTDMADVDVANTPPGGGSALAGTLGFFGEMSSSAYTVRPQKGGMFAGPSDPRLAALANAGRKTGNPGWTVLNNFITGYKTWRTVTYPGAWGGPDYQFSERYAGTLSALVKYFADPADTVARDVAVMDLQTPGPAIGTASCDESRINCGLPATSYADYSPSNFALWLAQALTWIEGETGWTSTDRNRMVSFLLNDNCWYEGGLAPTNRCPGQSPGPYNHVNWKIHSVGGADDFSHGTTPTTLAGNITVNITGGNLIADGVAAGDIIFFPHPMEDSGGAAYKIASLTATSVTLTQPIRSNLTNGKHFAVGRDWSDGDMGMAYQRNHFGGSYLYGCGTCFHYPPQGGQGEVFSISHNLPLVRIMGEMATGLYACGAASDQVGCHAAERAMFWYRHTMLREAMRTNSNGFNSTKFFYNEWRMHAAHGFTISMLKNWLENGPDWNYGGLMQGMSNQWRHMFYPGRGVGPWMPFTAEYLSQYYFTPMMVMHNYPADVESRYAQNHILNVVGDYNTTKIQNNGSSYGWEHYLFRDPSITTEVPAVGSLSRNYLTECQAIWSASQCGDLARNVITSRTGWSLIDSIGMFVAANIFAADQGDQNGTSQVTLSKNNTPLIWGDTIPGYGLATGGSGSVLQIGALGNFYFPTAMLRLTLTPGTGVIPVPWQSTSANHTYARAVLTQAYDSAATVTLAERQWARVGEVYFTHDRSTSSTAQPHRSWWHPAINSCGTVTSSPCIAVNLGARTIVSSYPQVSPTTGLGLLALPVGGSAIAMATQVGPATDLSYTYVDGVTTFPGAGRSGRVEVCSSVNGTSCANATSHESVVVMVPTSGAGSSPVATATTVGVHRIIEVTAPSTAVMALTAGGATATSLTFATSHSGSAPYLIAGLPAGVYNVTRNGTAVSGSPFTVASGEGSLAFSSTSGTIAAAQTGLPLNIDTASLPSGTVGVVYSQTLAGSGGSGTGYTWSLPSGSLPPGLSLNSATGEISGTPSAAGTYTFTVGLADSASGSDTQPLSITIGAPAGGSAATGTLLRGVVCRGCTVK